MFGHYIGEYIIQPPGTKAVIFFRQILTRYGE